MKMTQNAFQQDIKDRFTFYPPVTVEQQQDHEIVNAIFVDAAVKLSQICPQSPELETAINHLAISRAMANASLAIYVNSRNHQEEDDGIIREEFENVLDKSETKKGVENDV
jgi:hypothetical protein